MPKTFRQHSIEAAVATLAILIGSAIIWALPPLAGNYSSEFPTPRSSAAPVSERDLLLDYLENH